MPPGAYLFHHQKRSRDLAEDVWMTVHLSDGTFVVSTTRDEVFLALEIIAYFCVLDRLGETWH